MSKVISYLYVSDLQKRFALFILRRNQLSECNLEHGKHVAYPFLKLIMFLVLYEVNIYNAESFKVHFNGVRFDHKIVRLLIVIK